MTEKTNADGSPIAAEAKVVLSPDQAAGRVRGTDENQNPLSFCRGVEVTPIAVSGFTEVQGIAVAVKPVDRRTIEGSYAGDSRAKGADAQLPLNPAPREPKGQTANGRNLR